MENGVNGLTAGVGWVFRFVTGGGILMLHNDVQTCGYEDVQVMWEMLRRSQLEISSSSSNGNLLKQHRPFWRSFVWSSSSNALRRNRRTSSSTSPLVADIA
ncbi:unnamed protein product [Linum trigynum]|uniref:Uncharacterized protein n=1 Tax=Linum trigynum TaxID=586398 RepID=A0AAV2FQJ5_9ROSI